MIITKIEMKDIVELQQDSYTNLIAPMDDMYENGIIPLCTFYSIKENDEVIGFFAVQNKLIMQFHVINEYKKDMIELFSKIVELSNIEGALVASYDKILYNLSKSKAESIKENDLLFKEGPSVDIKPPFKNIYYYVVKTDEIEKFISYFNEIGLGGDWIKPYIIERVKKAELYAFNTGGTLLGTGEIRLSDSSHNIVNVGMSVSPQYRNKGLGTFILSTLRKIAKTQSFKAICSTNITNIESQRAILKAGFVKYHSIDIMKFN
jgi:predicted acetyltransferase